MNPAGYQYPVSLRTWLSDNQLSLLLAAPAQRPLNGYDFPNPRGAGFPISLRTFADGGWPLVSAMPFTLTEFPNPRSAIHPTSFHTWIDDSYAMIFAPGAADDGWLPIYIRRRHRGR